MILKFKSLISTPKFLIKKIFVRIRIKHLIKDLYNNILYFYRLFLQWQMVSKKKFINNINNYFSENLDEIEFRKLVPRRKIKFNEEEKEFLDLNILCSKRIKNNKDKGYVQREVFLSKFKNVQFFGHSGGLVIGKKPLLESTCTLTRLRNYTFTVDSVLLKHRNMKGAYTSIMHIFNHVFYHFLIECIPRLYGILQIEELELNLIIPAYTPKWQFEILKIFLDKRFNLLPIRKNEVWELENFYFSSLWHTDCSAYIPRKLLDFLRIRVFNNYGIKTNIERKRRIILSREKLNRRSILNRKEFIELLEKYSFEDIHPQDLPFKEQVELFNSAEIVIGMEGSAFANIVFGTNLKVVVIFPSNYIGTHHLLFCKALGFIFRYIIGNDSTPQFDCKVNINELEKVIKELLLY